MFSAFLLSPPPPCKWNISFRLQVTEFGIDFREEVVKKEGKTKRKKKIIEFDFRNYFAFVERAEESYNSKEKNKKKIPTEFSTWFWFAIDECFRIVFMVKGVVEGRLSPVWFCLVKTTRYWDKSDSSILHFLWKLSTQFVRTNVISWSTRVIEFSDRWFLIFFFFESREWKYKRVKAFPSPIRVYVMGTTSFDTSRRIEFIRSRRLSRYTHVRVCT